MISKIKAAILTLTAIASLGAATVAASLSVAQPVAAQPSIVASFKSSACGGISEVGGTGCGGAQSSISHLMTVAINLLSLVAGFIAVVMVIISGIRFMTAQGDASGLASARQSLIYALVGVVVAGISQLLVHFVIKKVG